MYEAYFHLKCRPFDLAPDPRFMYLTAQHSRAVANVRFALINHDSFVIITGEIGTGKTTVLNTALAELGPKFVAARLVHTTLSDVELLQALLSEFGIPNYGTKRVKLLDALRAHFLEQHAAGRHVVIIVDEARELEPAVASAAALLSPATGIIDVHEWMNALLSDVEAHGGVLVLNTSVQRVRPSAFGESWRLMRLALGILDEDRVFLNLSPKGEPRLGSRGLFADAERLGLFWILYFFPMAGTVCSTLPNGHTCRSGNFARGPGALRSAVY